MAKLGKITEDLAIGSCAIERADVDVELITEDSRAVRPGALFVARPGTKHDGRRFIPGAIDAGAVAILTDHSVTPDAHPSLASGDVPLLRTDDVPLAAAQLAERFHGNPSRDLTLIGVTGTNGKTTITHIIRHTLDALGLPCGIIGTVAIDDGLTSVPASLTTPSAIDLSAALARMRDAGRKAAVLEVSSHALDQGRVAGLEFDVAVFTNLTGDHLDYHLTLDAYAQAKAQLFTTLPATAGAIVNADDPWHARITRDCPVAVTHCSRRPETEPHYAIIPTALSLGGIEADVHTPTDRFTIASPLVGQHNLMNLLQAVAVLDRLGYTPADIRRALASVGAPPGRLEPVRPSEASPPFSVFVDYAHTDDALDNVLSAVRPFTPGSLILVFGCGGDRDRTKRPRMGAAAARHADRLFLTSDNPRTEDPRAIIEDVLAGIPADARPALTIEPDRATAIERAIAAAAPGDLVLIAGKGHEDYQLLPDGHGGIERIDFDDRVVAADALRRRHAAPDRAPAAHSGARP